MSEPFVLSVINFTPRTRPLHERIVPLHQIVTALKFACSRREVAEVYERVTFSPARFKSRLLLMNDITSGNHDSLVVADALLAVKPGFFTCVEV